MVSSVNCANGLNETECKADHRAKGLICWRPDISFNRISGLNQGQGYTYTIKWLIKVRYGIRQR